MKELLDYYLGTDWATYLGFFLALVSLFIGSKIIKNRKQVQKVGNNSSANQFGDNANVTINKKDN
ncbi:hypothetical protein F0259_05580 [Vibrio cyclitrophicus]|uniref:Uncharacterized protein n=1 Tax=Vibrio echinoideorum TaxID=2100116 RepID=A0ABU9FS65_9VIBR|nr:hypothetical protein [Vibrio cyclitrophicus]KAA8600130.1 hypothetical protein F0Z19_2052 [Vibrio cyclitrophicus]NOH43293.1 hypothetical protein [Vibrio cyclitrophicus]